MKTKIKICCIKTVEEARLAIRYGATGLGLVSEAPSGPGVISLEQIKEIIDSLPPFVASILLTTKSSVEEIISQISKTNPTTVQICDAVDVSAYGKIRSAFPSLKILQVIHVLGKESIDEAKRVAKFVDGILLDSGNPNLSIKQLGGTGKTHDWSLSAEICRSVDKPVILAGGLNETNIISAIQTVQPFGVDLCGGVRVDDRLDEEKLQRFMKRALEA